MSPEQARGLATLDHRCDVWALGVIAYEALTAFLPYDGETTADLLVNICTTRSVPVRRYNDAVPEALEPFFLKAFAPKVNDRFQTAVELGEAITAIARAAGRIPEIVTVQPPPHTPVLTGPAAVSAATHRSDAVPNASVATFDVLDKATSRTFTTGGNAPVPMQARWPFWLAIAALLVFGTAIAIKMSGAIGKDSEVTTASSDVPSATPTPTSVVPKPPSAAVLPTGAVGGTSAANGIDVKSAMPTGPTAGGTALEKGIEKGIEKGKKPGIPSATKATTAPSAPVSTSVTAPVPTVTATPSATVTTKKSVDKGEIL